jgi:hypothetical protein
MIWVLPAVAFVAVLLVLKGGWQRPD